LKTIKKKIILHADDLGLSLSFNEGIIVASQKGYLTSTCIRVNGAAYQHAIKEVIPKIPHIGIGLHLNIVEGKSNRTNIKSNEILCQLDGKYRLGFFNLFRKRKCPQLLAEIEADFRNQIEIVLSDLNYVDHLNSHQHSHGISEIFDLVCRLAKEYGIPYVRLPRERFYKVSANHQSYGFWYLLNILKWIILNLFSHRNSKIAQQYNIKVPDWFVGILYTGHMSIGSILNGIKRIQREAKVVEVLLHPAKPILTKDEIFLNGDVRDYVLCPYRKQELETLINPFLKKKFDTNGWDLCNFSDLVNQPKTIIPNTKIPKVIKSKKNNLPLKAYFILDETPFYQPEYFARLVRYCKDIEVVGVSVVKLPHGGVLQKYLLKNWYNLGIINLVKLGLKSFCFRLFGLLPCKLKGDFFGSVESVARTMKIPHKIINQINTAEHINDINKLSPDLIISSNSLILGEKLIKLPKIACINRHSALLPSLGGILPVFRAVQYEHKFTGASVHFVVKKIDAGNILARKWIPIFKNDKMTTLYKACFRASYEATIEGIAKLRSGEQNSVIDNEGLKHSYYSFPKDTDWKEFNKRDISFS